MRLLLALAVLADGWAACLPVKGERILGRDFAAAIPSFSVVADRVIAPAPLAGSERRFTRAELERVARRLGLEPAAAGTEAWPDAICFAYVLRPLEEERVRTALAKTNPSLAGSEILDWSRFPVPDGPIEFGAANSTPDRRDRSLLLRGSVAYAPGRRQPVWVRLRAEAPPAHLVARDALVAGAPVRAEALESRPSLGQPGISRFEDLQGLVPRRAIAPGTILTRAMFGRAREVDAGQTVDVRVRSGRARLAFQAKAETGGFTGDYVVIRSPLSNQRLKARVSERGRVLLEVTSASAAMEGNDQ